MKTNQIETALMAAAEAAAKPESKAYAEELSAVLLKSGLSEIQLRGYDHSSWVFWEDNKSVGIRLSLTDGQDGHRRFGAVWNGWASQLVTSYHAQRVQHHYTIAQNKLLAAANIFVTADMDKIKFV